MIILALTLTIVFSLFSLSLIAASKKFQDLRPQIECFLKSDNEKIRFAAKEILKDSLSFFSSYRIMFNIITSSVDEKNNFNEEEEKAAKKLIEFFLLVNVKAYWYNYLLIILFLLILILFFIMRNRIGEIINNFSLLINIEKQYFTKSFN